MVLQVIARDLITEYTKGKKLGGVLVDLGYISIETLNNELEVYNYLEKRAMFGTFLVDRHVIAAEVLDKALDLQTNYDFSEILKSKDDKEIIELCALKGITKFELVRRFESRSGAKYVDISTYNITTEVTKLFNMDSLKNNNIIPLTVDESNKIFRIASSELTDQDNIKSVIIKNASKNGFLCEFLFAFQFEIDSKYAELEATKPQYALLEDDQTAVNFVNNMITEAIERNASDIHFEPQKIGVRVRYRIDGLLIRSDIFNYDQTATKEILTLIKVMSSMDSANSRKPQGGSIKDYTSNEKTYDIRVSIIQTINGEKAVLRVIPKGDHVKTFGELGYSTYYENLVKGISNKSGGILFIAGSTGSGKTTTLYTIIDHMNTPDKNICCLEDPVEKEVPGISQVNITLNAGASINERSEKYTEYLLELLRQDPDIIVLGEIRDKSVGDIALKASLTGHLVMTTVHANSALDTLTRLYDMGIDNIILSSSILGIIAQKLIRRICPNCKTKRKLTEDESIYVECLNKKYNSSHLLEYMHYGKGCNKCNNTGYSGRIAVPEIVLIDESIKKLIYLKTSESVIYTKLIESGYRTIEYNAFLNVIDGLSTIDEVKRVM